MSETSKAVFLSYASQDAEAARRICNALRAAGVEVFFDQSELVGGDAWDRKIRGQIASCALFLPIISAATQARREGYFRIEWKLAAQRTHAMADGTPFVLPVVTDATGDSEALVPDEFRSVQWTRLPAGAATPEFVARVKKLLSGLTSGPVRPTSLVRDAAKAELPSDTAATPAAGSSVDAPVRDLPAVKRPAWPVLAAVLAVALAVVSVGWWRASRTPARASQIRSLAVLPFAFETQDPKLAGLGKWIPAEIRSKLGPLQNLQVVNSPARIEQLVQQKKSEVEIARELGVDGLVVGELHGQGETMSAYVSVVDGSTGRALGRQREIASAASKVSELPNQVALAIVDELKLQISTSERTEIGSGETQNAEAFLAFQKGRDLLSSRLFDQATVELRRAYQLDANYTRAWALGAESEWVPFIYGGTTNEMAATFKRLSVEAERLHAQRPADQVLATPRMLIAMIFERDWNKASAVFWESQRNAKPDASVLSAMSWYYAMIEGHPEPALHAIEQAIGMAPENFLFPINRGYQLLYFGRYDDAASAFRKLPPEKIQLEDYSRVLLMAGDLTGAKEVATRVLAGRPNAWTQCCLAAVHAKSGAPDEARKILGELETQAEKGMHIPYAQIAWSYGMLGDFDAARRWLRKGLLEGHGDWSMLTLRTAEKLEVFGRLAWYWEMVDGMKFPPLQMDNPYFALEQAMRYGRGTVGPAATGASASDPPRR